MWEKELELAKNLAVKAGKKIMEYYHDTFTVSVKSDDSPVTSADLAANRIIINALVENFPSYAILSEENNDDFARLENDYVWIIDPLDGTKDFVDHSDGFAVNIALCYKHKLVVGVVYVPVTEELFFASKGNGSYFSHGEYTDRIHVNDKLENLTCLISKHHFNDAEKNAISRHSDKITNCFAAGASIKPCLIAKGDAEISYRLSSSTKEWDTAAPQIILEEAGGFLLKTNGEPITYNRHDVYNREGYVLMNRKENFLL